MTKWFLNVVFGSLNIFKIFYTMHFVCTIGVVSTYHKSFHFGFFGYNCLWQRYDFLFLLISEEHLTMVLVLFTLGLIFRESVVCFCIWYHVGILMYLIFSMSRLSLTHLGFYPKPYATSINKRCEMFKWDLTSESMYRQFRFNNNFFTRINRMYLHFVSVQSVYDLSTLPIYLITQWYF